MNKILTALILEIESANSSETSVLFTNRYGAERQKSLSSDCTFFHERGLRIQSVKWNVYFATL